MDKREDSQDQRTRPHESNEKEKNKASSEKMNSENNNHGDFQRLGKEKENFNMINKKTQATRSHQQL